MSALDTLTSPTSSPTHLHLTPISSPCHVNPISTKPTITTTTTTLHTSLKNTITTYATNIAKQGFELLSHLLTHNPSPTAQPYRIIMGARDVPRTLAAFDTLRYDTARHSVTVLPLELFDLANTRAFARESLARLSEGVTGEGAGKVDYLLLNAALGEPNSKGKVGPWGWGEGIVVNHLCESSVCVA